MKISFRPVFPPRALFRLALLVLCLGAPAPVSAEILLHDDFSTHATGAAPSGWETDHKWRVRKFGGRTVVGQEDETALGNRPLTRPLPRQLEQSWMLDFDYAWMWGGTAKHGFNDLRLDVELVDKTGNGYRLRIPQGRHRTGMDSGLVPAEELLLLYRIQPGKPAMILGEGGGYDAPGWKTAMKAEPEFHRIRVAWDRIAGRLTVYRRVNARWDEVIRSDEASHARLDKLVFNPALLNNTCTPQIGRVTLRAPEELAWGVCGGVDAPGAELPIYGDIGAAEAIRRVKELGLAHYRVDVFGMGEAPDESSLFDRVSREARDRGVAVLPVLHPGDSSGIATERLYETARRRGLNFARHYRDQFKHVEIATEMDLDCLLPGRGGAASWDYDAEKLARSAEIVRGLCDGVREGDPAARRLVGAAGWQHHGFIDALLQRGVQFEGLAWRWQPEAGSMQRLMTKLSSYGKPIWVTRIGSGRSEPAAAKLSAGERSTAEAERAGALRAMLREIGGFPLVRGLFVHELFDRAPVGTTRNPEHYQGLHSVWANPLAGRVQPADALPVADVVKAMVKERGGLPAMAGAAMVTDRDPPPAFRAQGNAVRFSPYVAEAGRHAVFARFAAGGDAARRASVAVRHRGGVSDLAITPGTEGAWVWLGDFDFERGESGEGAAVDFARTSGSAVAQAIQFQRKLPDAFPDADLASLGEPDLDGVPTLVKLATALPVGVKSAKGPVEIGLADGRLWLAFDRFEPAPVDYAVEASDDMRTWTPVATLLRGTQAWGGAAPAQETGAGAIRRVRISDVATPATTPRRFLRLRVGPGELASDPQGYVTVPAPEGGTLVQLVPEAAR